MKDNLINILFFIAKVNSLKGPATAVQESTQFIETSLDDITTNVARIWVRRVQTEALAYIVSVLRLYVSFIFSENRKGTGGAC